MRIYHPAGLVYAGLAAIALLALGATPKVTLRVYPRVVPAGQAVRLTCRVPRDPGNRGLTIGLRDYRTSYVQLDGVDAPITTEVTIDRVPCDPGPAFCALTTERGLVTDQLDLVVANCGDPDLPCELQRGGDPMQRMDDRLHQIAANHYRTEATALESPLLRVAERVQGAGLVVGRGRGV